jgi:uncharacterized protein
MQNFTPVSALIGGSLIGLSVTLLMFLNGRIAGISGMLHGLLPFKENEFTWRVLFLIGLIIGGFVYYLLPQIHFSQRSHYSIYLLVLSGFFVGIGTKLGSGCTSGHGVCGIARMSPRSFVATGVFFIFGLFPVYTCR